MKSIRGDKTTRTNLKKKEFREKTSRLQMRDKRGVAVRFAGVSSRDIRFKGDSEFDNENFLGWEYDDNIRALRGAKNIGGNSITRGGQAVG